MKALIVDDEFVVVEGMKKMIDWSKYGIEIIGKANDGITALDLFRTNRPQIIFTDIRMPGMDGLELIAKILEEAPETICIVFSGFREFEYARKALKLGVTDYLEKPITIPMIEETIERVMKHIEEQSELVKFKKDFQENQQMRLEKVSLDLLLQANVNIEMWKEAFGSNSDKVTGVIVFAHSGGDFTLESETSLFKAVPISDGCNQLFVIYILSDKLDQLFEKFPHLIDKESIVAAGRVYESISDVYKSYEESLKALRYGTFFQSKGLIRFENISKNTELSDEILNQRESILYSMRLRDKVAVENALASYLLELEKETIHPDFLEGELLKLFYSCMDIVKENGNTLNDLNYLPQLEIDGIHTKKELQEWLQAKIELMLDEGLQKKHNAIEKACRYIKKHYNKDISLQEIADFVKLNPNYLSMLFKDVMGTTYIKYLTQIRIEMAKVMLKNGETVSEVSEKVGYSTYRHFSDIFKRNTGIPPGKYKEIAASQEAVQKIL